MKSAASTHGTGPLWRRPPVLALLGFISVIGFLGGIGLRGVGMRLRDAAGGNSSVTTPLVTVSVATKTPDLPAMSPEPFILALNVTPVNVAAGATFTIVAHATVLQDNTVAARGVSVSPVIDGITLTPPLAPDLTDAHGDVTWSVPVPAGAPPGSYKVTVNGRWGSHTYFAYVFVRVTG